MHHDSDEGRDRQTRDDDPAVPNRAANMEKAEGSRDTPGEAVGSEVPPAAFGEQGGGISNRPVGEEQERQENVPPRGQRRDERHNEDVER